jgi:hypothetical protein
VTKNENTQETGSLLPRLRSGFPSLFQIERETKNTVRYQEVVATHAAEAATDPRFRILDMAEAIVGTIYIKKKTTGDHIPERIIVEVYPSND